jgi:hypothetical protein
MNGESAYLNGLADYICGILPEDPRRQKKLLLAVKRRMRPRMPRWMLVASTAFLAAVGGIVAGAELNARWDAAPHARMATLPDGRVALKIITEGRDGAITVLWYRHITAEEAVAVMAEPDWQTKLLASYSKLTSVPASAPASAGRGS